MTRIALTRAVPSSMASCELTHVERSLIDVSVAASQHAAYEGALRDAGCTLHRIADEPAMPDSVFVEDCAVVLGGHALITRPGATSRRGETASVADALSRYCTTHLMAAPGTLDGGDVLTVGRMLFVGETERTSAAGFERLRDFATPLGYTAAYVPVTGCLHLKTAVAAVDDETVVINPDWISASAFPGLRVLPVDPAEPFAANVLRVGSVILVPSAHPKTAEMLHSMGYEVRTVDMSELAKAEGGITCCSIIIEAD